MPHQEDGDIQEDSGAARDRTLQEQITGETPVPPKAVLAHAQYFAELIEREGERLKGHGQLEAIKILGIELENIYEGLDTALNREDADLLLPFAKYLESYLDILSRWQEGLSWYERILSEAERLKQRPLQMQASLGLSRLLWRLSRYEEAEKEVNAAKKLAEEAGDRKSLALALHNLGFAVSVQGRYEEAEQLHQESLKIFREIGDRRGIASSLNSLGNVAYNQGRDKEAEKLYQESLEIRREIGDGWGIALSLRNLGVIAYLRGRYKEAEKLFQENLKTYREIGDRSGIANSLNNLGIVAHMQGKYDEAERLYKECLKILREIGDRAGTAMSLNNLGALFIKVERFSDARLHLQEALQVSSEIGARDMNIEGLVTCGYLLVMTGRLKESAVILTGAERQAKEMNYKLQPMEQSELDEGMAKVKDTLSAEELAEARARAEEMNLEELTEFALKALEGLDL
ncbi:tetratricopeptide repeat protein [bacterium]|nr:tetratricopeptide repeat protein [bacterium]